ncbi:DALR anticodon-binding domain-containing protein 3 [Habropoda laboriosa]|uniref:DALR anticodon-binding domain-containing protein 3 n=1 Tax=Habropoda laboriosa TaxID=597456 RepID=A0A0L7QQ96_9HYME|nr:PREDICTED: DALR anticodon-binding domain-containing protein 3 [Habropoda laboriosa]KOC60666.1 DALR anticodon-binding domain-containing protein 3 [Habropoda laboriosa]
MESISPICIEALINRITSYLSGNVCKNISIVKVNNDNLATNGDLHFSPSLKVWARALKCTEKCNGTCATILQHFLHVRNNDTDNKTGADIANQVLQLLISFTNNWSMKIEKSLLEKERVCLFLQRTPLIENSIKAAVNCKCDFGKILSHNKVFSLKSLQDKESELTTARLHLIQSVTEKVLNQYGCEVSEEHSDRKFIFTTKSQGNMEKNYEKYVCGVVKNTETNCKEINLKWQEYIKNKVEELKELNEQKYFEAQECTMKAEDYFLEKIAQATVKFELLSAKPSRPVLIGCNFATDKSPTNTKGASFILYNAARITAIIDKYNDKRLRGEYPNLVHINDVDFSLLKQEEEWELVYNFIIGYQEMIKDCLKLDPIFQTNPQVICIFLSRLCQKFSIYYHRIRILTEAYDHLIPTMIARLYMLYALQIVLQNALSLLDITPVSRM